VLGKILISPLFLRRAPLSKQEKEREKGKKKVRQGKLSREKEPTTVQLTRKHENTDPPTD
jgi:hypothetical protein